MCGIAGVVTWDERCRTTRDTLARMSAAVAHRGPDGEGMWFNHEGEVSPGRPQAALAHRRLAIIDPDPRADQPFTDGHGRWIVFNGEIYNFRDLRHELTLLRPEYDWRTRCDTEVLLVAYAAWGPACVKRLNGMFAFAVWDENARRCSWRATGWGKSRCTWRTWRRTSSVRATTRPPAKSPACRRQACPPLRSRASCPPCGTCRGLTRRSTRPPSCTTSGSATYRGAARFTVARRSSPRRRT
jgi:glucosamine 6-phosphate synthetase-like amidotransferase/phosphosugar isomerase protein